MKYRGRGGAQRWALALDASLVGARRATVALGVVASAALMGATVSPLGAQVTSGREVVESLTYPQLVFEPPEAERHDVAGVPVLLLASDELPLVTVHAYFKGGYGLFGREHFAAGMGLPTLLRYGGTRTLAPDSVDVLLEHSAIQTSFGSAGGAVTSSMNTLTEQLDVALDLWGDLLTQPGFDEDEIEVWRGRQLESALRLRDDPARLAYSRFNTLLFGDHPIGWELEPDDLTPELLTPARFAAVHARVLCRENLVLGVTGDARWAEMEERLSDLVERIPECAEELPEPPAPEIRDGGGVFLIEKDLEQAVIVMAHPTEVHLEDSPEYFSAQVGNSILGAGGFSSRLLARVRTEHGFAYGATSIWTTPREHPGILGAITRTSPANAVPAIDVILEAMDELRSQPPTTEDVGTVVDQIVNGFVFNFSSADQIVARTMFYMAQDLPADWLELYWRGVQRVTPQSVLNVFAAHLRPEQMTILLVGDPDRIGREALEALGPLTILDER